MLAARLDQDCNSKILVVMQKYVATRPRSNIKQLLTNMA